MPNVWKCTEQLVNVGVIGYDHDLFDYSEDSYHELYGDIYNIDTFGFTGIEDMKKDLAFYSVVPGNGDLTTQAGDLYVYSTEGNPGSRFNSIEIGERINIVSGSPNGATFDNLAFKFTGGHAIGFGTCKDVTVTNCVFSWIGGSVLSGNGVGNPATNYGNAIEIYGGCDGYRVENNWMYQIYDTAVTHQRSATTGDCTQENIRYTSNLMEYVHWGIETYNAPPTKEILNGKKDTYTRYTKDYRARYNLLRFGGYGWGSLTRYRTNSARLYCCAAISDNEDQLAEYNIIDRCAGYLLNIPDADKEEFDKNIYIQTLGCTVGYIRGGAFTCDFTMADRISKNLGDKNAVVIVTEPEAELTALLDKYK